MQSEFLAKLTVDLAVGKHRFEIPLGVEHEARILLFRQRERSPPFRFVRILACPNERHHRGIGDRQALLASAEFAVPAARQPCERERNGIAAASFPHRQERRLIQRNGVAVQVKLFKLIPMDVEAVR